MFGIGGVPPGAEPPIGGVAVEVVFEPGVAFGFPGAMGFDPPEGLASGSTPAPRIIDAICIIPRRVSGFDLLELLARKDDAK